MGHPLADDRDDAVTWWQAYSLAENDEAGELRRRAGAGDDHARRQLACWLADRDRADEAVELIRPLADAGDDIAQLCLARWLGLGRHPGHIEELRQRAGSGNYHDLQELAGWLADHGELGQLRELLGSGEGGGGVRPELAGWLARQHNLDVTRVAADAGDDDARRRLASYLARRGAVDELRQRAGSGDEHAARRLAEL